ncbi:Hypothetical_protein [Hexamita inflata]|uniref:Hypothetical_protein n=1 Tax=Hexamita inflata TaxID=28002 RepID=A0AA86U6E0_9EUKA|nr:Hypothetical protein HINF_LOCUS27182 [Hexamita inflata]
MEEQQISNNSGSAPQKRVQFKRNNNSQSDQTQLAPLNHENPHQSANPLEITQKELIKTAISDIVIDSVEQLDDYQENADNHDTNEPNEPNEISEADNQLRQEDNEKSHNSNELSEPDPLEHHNTTWQRKTPVERLRAEAIDDIGLNKTVQLVPGPDVIEYDLPYKNQTEVEIAERKPRVLAPTQFKALDEDFHKPKENSYVPNREIREIAKFGAQPNRKKSFLNVPGKPLNKVKGDIETDASPETEQARKTTLPQLKKITK